MSGGIPGVKTIAPVWLISYTSVICVELPTFFAWISED